MFYSVQYMDKLINSCLTVVKMGGKIGNTIELEFLWNGCVLREGLTRKIEYLE